MRASWIVMGVFVIPFAFPFDAAYAVERQASPEIDGGSTEVEARWNTERIDWKAARNQTLAVQPTPTPTSLSTESLTTLLLHEFEYATLTDCRWGTVPGGFSSAAPGQVSPEGIPPETIDVSQDLAQIRYEFANASLEENGGSAIPGGFTPGTKAGSARAIDFTGTPIDSSQDKRGLLLLVNPGEVSFIYANAPVNTQGKPVLLRLTLLADAPDATVTLGVLKGSIQQTDGSTGWKSTFWKPMSGIPKKFFGERLFIKANIINSQESSRIGAHWKEDRFFRRCGLLWYFVTLYRNPPRGGPFVCFDEMGAWQTILRGGKSWGEVPSRRPDRYKRNGALQWLCAFSPYSGKSIGKGYPTKPATIVGEFWEDYLLEYWPTGCIHHALDNLKTHNKALRELPAKGRMLDASK